jgi:hypothetical protein
MVAHHRTPVSRQWRPGRFAPEVLDLFLKCEATPLHLRTARNETWVGDSKRLAKALGLVIEWFCSRTVNDARPPPDDDPTTLDYQRWKACRDVREELLVAVELASKRASPEQTRHPREPASPDWSRDTRSE